MQFGYQFKRDFYYEVKESFSKSNFIFLLGPRKCGKTVALLQLRDELSNAIYYDFKGLSEDESRGVFGRIRDAMVKDDDTVFLLDEITYAWSPEREIEGLALRLAEAPIYKTKVVFTGSQSVALEAWANRSFCGNAVKIRADFLSYDEWLRYKGITISTEETYLQFLVGAEEFYNFTSLEGYLQACLDETIISNKKTDNVIVGNDAYLVDVSTLLDICYATLFTLHNHVTVHKFVENNKLLNSIKHYFSDVCREVGDDEIGRRIASSFIGRYENFKTKDLKTLKQSLLFLLRAGLVTITPVSNSAMSIPNIRRDLSLVDSGINYKDELFNSYNVCIRYPMFYVAIIKDILGKQFTGSIPAPLLGSIVECHVRGNLKEDGAFEFRDEYGHEVDYVNVINGVFVEVSVANKQWSKINFKYVQKEYYEIILTKNILEKYEQGVKIPYHDFIRVAEKVYLAEWKKE